MSNSFPIEYHRQRFLSTIQVKTLRLRRMTSTDETLKTLDVRICAPDQSLDGLIRLGPMRCSGKYSTPDNGAAIEGTGT
jgi:hypothetical protein